MRRSGSLLLAGVLLLATPALAIADSPADKSINGLALSLNAGYERAAEINRARREAMLQRKMMNPNFNPGRDGNNPGYQRAQLLNTQRREEMRIYKMEHHAMQAPLGGEHR